jgi:hypothetical protein
MGYSHEKRRKLRSQNENLLLRPKLQKGRGRRNFFALRSESRSKGVAIADEEFVKLLHGRIVIEIV